MMTMIRPLSFGILPGDLHYVHGGNHEGLMIIQASSAYPDDFRVYSDRTSKNSLPIEQMRQIFQSLKYFFHHSKLN